MIPIALKNKINATLFISALYFMIWSVIVIISPTLLSTVVINKESAPLIFWDFIGLITFVLGIAMLIAAFNPYRHWPLILIVSLFHLFMIGGFLWGFADGFFNMHFLPFLFFNHLVWLIPNGYVLYQVYQRRFSTDEMLIDSFNNVQFPLSMFDTTTGENIGELSEKNPVMLIFLRHFGCPFCKDSLLSLTNYRHGLEAKGISIVLVYMSDEATANGYLSQYKLNDLMQVSDPEEIFYKSFKLGIENK